MGCFAMDGFITPIHKISLNNNNNHFYMKRDDLLPFSFGGNKARKALYFFNDILDNGFDTVVTYGASSSNHCRIIANLAIKYGLACYIISPNENYIPTYNSRLVEMFHAKIIKTSVDTVSSTINETLKKLNKSCKPYFIQGGGHGNLGTQAYVDAYGEICDYEEKTNLKFDYIFHASGTGTTQAGLVVGQFQRKRPDQKIIGISIARTLERGRKVIIDSINDYLNGVSQEIDGYVNFIDSYISGGYGKVNMDIIETVKSVLKNDGIALNTTYTGKAMYGMEKYIVENDIKNKNILFINTGGTPLFFDDLERYV